MSRARSAKSKVLYRGHDISDYIIDFSYTDNYDKTDDISIRLSDRAERWISDWFPETGDTLIVSIEVFDWNAFGDNRSLPLGSFEVDNVEFSDTVSINAVAVPITSSARSEKKHRVWVNILLSGIAGDISASSGLSLVYETNTDPFYDNADQNDKSNLEFLEELCKSDGLCMKATDSQLIIFEEMKYEEEPAVITIMKGSSDIIGFPRFSRNAKNVYKACEISHFDPKTDELYVGYFEAPDVGNVGHTLKLRESFNSESDDINLGRKAKARLREQNKYEWICNITLKGDIFYFAGINVEYKGWNRFDGKYHIATCTYSIGSSGFTVSINTRRCLEGY